MHDIVLIANPNARKGKALKKIRYIVSYFSARNRNVELFYTKKIMDASDIARRCSDEGCNLVVVAGGDGSVNECADGLMRSNKQTDLAIIPIGRGNDFAYTLKIPTKLKAACDLILNENPKKIDVGFVQGGLFPSGRYFVNGVGIGFEPTVNFKATSYKHLNGMPSYVMAFFYVLLHTPKPVKTKLAFSGNTLNVDTQQISICNGRRMGSSFILAPNAKVNDGKLDLVLATKPVSGLEMFSVAFDFFKGKQLRRSYFKEYKIDEVLIGGESEFPVHADGEIISYGTDRCYIKIVPSSLGIYMK